MSIGRWFSFMALWGRAANSRHRAGLWVGASRVGGGKQDLGAHAALHPPFTAQADIGLRGGHQMSLRVGSQAASPTVRHAWSDLVLVE